MNRVAKEKIKLALEDIVEYENDEDYKNSIAKVKFLSNRPNSHKINFSEDVIKECAPTVLDAWLIAEYSELTQDATTHTDEQWLQGKVMANQEVQFEYDEDGYLVASVDVAISKLYAKQIYDLFKTDNSRAVSCELLANYGEILEDGTKDVLDFDICAISILGKAYNPSIPKSEIVITKFSEEEANKEYEQYITKNKEDNILNKVLDKLEEISDKITPKQIEIKEENMADIVKFAIEIGDELWSKVWNGLRDKYPDEEDGWCSKYSIRGIYEDNGDKYVIVSGKDGYYKIGLTYTETEFELSDELVEVKQEFVEMAEVIKFDEAEVAKFAETEKEKDELAKKEEEPKEEEKPTKDDTKEEEMGCKEKMSELETELESCKIELAELRKFKADVLAEQTKEQVTETLESVKGKVSDECFSKFEEEAKECTYETISAWKTSVFAKFGEEMIKLASQKDEEDVVIGVDLSYEEEVKSEEDVYERNKKYL